MAADPKTPGDLIFGALYLRYRSTTNVAWVMTRKELQEATGLPAEPLVDAWRDLVSPANEDLRSRPPRMAVTPVPPRHAPGAVIGSRSH